MRDEELRIQGTAVSDGIAIGVPFFLQVDQEEIPEFPITMKEVDYEIGRYRHALSSSRDDLKKIRTDLAEEGSDVAATIIDTHIQMLEDPLLTTEMEEKIRSMMKNTESVFHGAIHDYEKRFSHHTDSFFQERLVDVRDLAGRVLGHLCPRKGCHMEEIPFNSVVFAREIAPSHAASSQTSRIGAFVTQTGGGSSHAALIARAKGIPYVASIPLASLEEQPIRCVIVDGGAGEVILNPLPATLEHYKLRKSSQKASYQLLQKEMQYDAETLDGCAIGVFANIGNLSDLDHLSVLGVDGVGLFRTEYLFFENRDLIYSEEEQYQTYCALLSKVGSLPVVFRVFDVGGDKNPELSFAEEEEPNPVLGCRGIRFLLRYPDIFHIQLRAILRAAVHGDVRILLPLISEAGEVDAARAHIEACKEALRKEQIPFCDEIPVGCMIEVPSAVLICDVLAEKSDFLSIGTNDLVQYTLGVDRSNPLMSDACYPAHPSVLRMIKMVITESKRRGKSVSICGEIASNPTFIPLLLGLGAEAFSCAPRYIPFVRRAIRETRLLDAAKLADKVLGLSSSQEVSEALNK
ncbi:MAG: phosphoenolpyruvate--protein phosphotransferase [Verrucomicrobia bacterium]|nr:phosphoenolpyruvate--protein phosphotransferase [Verrucomicrobiota bacterium]